MEKTKGIRKFFKVVCIIIFILVLVAFVASLTAVYIFKKGNDAPVIKGYRLTLMQNATMGSAITEKSLILSEAAEKPSVGDIVMYRPEDINEFTVARLIAVDETDGETTYTLKADSFDSEILLGANAKFETVVYASNKLGRITAFATSYKGVFAFAIIPCGLLILFEIIMGIGSKRKRENEADVTVQTEENVGSHKNGPYHEKSPLTALIEEKTKNSAFAEGEVTDDKPVITANDAREMFSEKRKKKSEAKKSELFDEPKCDSEDKIDSESIGVKADDDSEAKNITKASEKSENHDEVKATDAISSENDDLMLEKSVDEIADNPSLEKSDDEIDTMVDDILEDVN